MREQERRELEALERWRVEHWVPWEAAEEERLKAGLPATQPPQPPTFDYRLPAIIRHPAATSEKTNKPPANLVVKARDVKSRPTEWLRKPVFVLRGLNMITGESDSGKTFIALDAAATYTTGRAWPEEPADTRHEPGNALIISHLPQRDIIMPRLESMGADIDRITFINADHLEGFTLDQLHDAWLAAGKPRLVIIDNTIDFLGISVKEFRYAEVAEKLNMLMRLVESVDEPICIIMVSPTGKGKDVSDAMHRVLGSVAWVGKSAIAHTTEKLPVEDEEPERWALLQLKSSMSGMWPGYTYRIVPNGESAVVNWLESAEMTHKDFLAQRKAENSKGAGHGPNPVKYTMGAVELLRIMREPVIMQVDQIVKALGDGGYLGKWDEDKRDWKNRPSVYRYKDFVPELEPPLDGWEILTSDNDPSLACVGSNKKRWHLVRKDRPMPGWDPNQTEA
jgi:hypothetical protein